VKDLALWEERANAETDPKIKAQMLDIVEHARRDPDSLALHVKVMEFLREAMARYVKRSP
jgi:hypothetical protein